MDDHYDGFAFAVLCEALDHASRYQDIVLCIGDEQAGSDDGPIPCYVPSMWLRARSPFDIPFLAANTDRMSDRHLLRKRANYHGTFVCAATIVPVTSLSSSTRICRSAFTSRNSCTL